MFNKPTWYLDVKEKENRTWSDEDKLNIYYMCKTHPAIDVAIKYRATINQIHNITRLTKKGINKQCYHCGAPLTDKEASTPKTGFVRPCNKCKQAFLDYKRERRERALNKHLCGVCGTQTVLEGHTACKDCISSTYRRRVKEGLCGHCGERPIKNKDGGLCLECLTNNQV